jgi:hypothetical protein
MSVLATVEPAIEGLPALVDRAAAALASARTSAEVLEAREIAGLAYDTAKRAARFAKAKSAHDELLSKVHRAQADALAIEAGAKMRLADEYDAAQERGEVQRPGGDRMSNVPDGNNAPTVEDLGLTRKQIYEARQVRDAERADPGIVRRTLNARISERQEPTRTHLRDVIARPSAVKPQPLVSQKTLWVWGRIKDFHRDGYMEGGVDAIFADMPEGLREDIRELAPAVADFIRELGERA